MIPSGYDYYRARVREHRRLAGAAASTMERAAHHRLVEAYGALARASLLRQVVTLKR